LNPHSALPIPPLPSAYGLPYLVCLVKNVNWVYVFWELTPEQLQHARVQLPSQNVRKVLRVLQGPIGQQQILLDMTITDDVGEQYIYLPQSGDCYQMEILLVGETGAILLLSSNFVITPFGQVSSSEDYQWAAIEELYQHFPTPFMQNQASSPQLWHISSPMGKIPPTKEELELEVNTELILYGRTTPGAVLFIQGEAMPTKPDGSFSFRYALPEGCSIFPIKVVSRSGAQTKTLVPMITRETY